MNTTSRPRWVLSLLLATSVSVLNPLAIATSEAAPQPSIATKATLMARRWGFRFRVRSSRYRRGGFARAGAGCPTANLTPLTPTIGSEGEDLGDQAPSYLTAADHPTFFVHVPPLPATKGKLTLSRPDLPLMQQSIYETEFDLNGQAGIVGIQIPESAPALEMGATYLWQVSVDCNPDDARFLGYAAQGGMVERVADTAGTTSERLVFYGNEGIWQDALALLAQQSYQAPTNAASHEDLASLLDEAGLDAIAHAPVVQMVTGQ